MPSPDPIHVLLVDDSRIFRSELELALRDIPDVVIAGSVFSGEKAIEFLDKTQVDLVTLDIAMPGMSGIETLRKIRARKYVGRSGRRVEALLLSSLTTQGARCTIEGLELGAYDFLLKPHGPSDTENRIRLRQELAEKLKPVRYQQGIPTSAKLAGTTKSVTEKSAEPLEPIRGQDPFQTALRATTALRSSAIKAIVIGVSTGGPEALSSLLPVLTTQTTVPIFIVQHNLLDFSEYLADSLSRKLPRRVTVPAERQDVLQDGVYLAKGGQHMLVSKVDGRDTIQVSDAPPENQFKPSVDVLFRSAAACYGSGLISAVLTGMLNDGAQGARAVKRAGGFVIAQDEATSIVWGMPRAAIEAGAVDWVLPLKEVGPTILKLVADPSQATHIKGRL